MSACSLSAKAFVFAVFIGLFLSVPCIHSAMAESQFDADNCRPKALATADNDIRLAKDDREPGKPADLPRPVAQKIADSANRLARRSPDWSSYGSDITCDMVFFYPVYRVTVSQHRYLYVADVTMPVGAEFFYLILYDPLSQAVTPDPPQIGSKWPGLFGAMDDLVSLPIVSSADLFRDHRRQIVFEERVHNGTVYNGIVYHYFEVGPRLGMTRVLVRETHVILFDKGLYDRESSSLAPTRIRLSLFLDQQVGNQMEHKLLGYSVLISAGVGKPFRVSEQHAIDKDFEKGLVTLNGDEGDNDFLRLGYTGYY